jgi:hypothetical protein
MTGAGMPIRNGLPVFLAGLVVFPLALLAICAALAAAVIAFIGDHVMLGMLCLPTISLRLDRAGLLRRRAPSPPRKPQRDGRWSARRVARTGALVAAAALAVVAGQWAVLILAVAVPLVVQAYAFAVSRALRCLACDLGRALGARDVPSLRLGREH